MNFEHAIPLTRAVDKSVIGPQETSPFGACVATAAELRVQPGAPAAPAGAFLGTLRSARRRFGGRGCRRLLVLSLGRLAHG